MSDSQNQQRRYEDEDSETITADIIQLAQAYSLGGESRLRDEFDRIFSLRSILERYLRRQIGLRDVPEQGEVANRIHALSDEFEA